MNKLMEEQNKKPRALEAPATNPNKRSEKKVSTVAHGKDTQPVYTKKAVPAPVARVRDAGEPGPNSFGYGRY